MTIGLLGGGNMGSAIIGGIHKNYRILVCEKDRSKAFGLKRKYNVGLADLADVVRKSNVIILAVKPQDFDAVLSEVSHNISGAKLVVSIAAGISTLYIEKRLRGKARVVRTMPNLPVQVREGITGICKGKWATRNDIMLVSKIFSQIGETVILNEKWMNAVTAVSGSGPAYVFYFIECLTKAARSLGLDEKTSDQLVKQTLKGSLSLLLSQKEAASVLRERVTSKGGTTQAALNEFFAAGLETIFKKALRAAAHRAKELSK